MFGGCCKSIILLETLNKCLNFWEGTEQMCALLSPDQNKVFLSVLFWKIHLSYHTGSTEHCAELPSTSIQQR